MGWGGEKERGDVYFCPGVNLKACVCDVMHSSPGHSAGLPDHCSSHAERCNCNRASQDVTPAVQVFGAKSPFGGPVLVCERVVRCDYSDAVPLPGFFCVSAVVFPSESARVCRLSLK